MPAEHEFAVFIKNQADGSPQIRESGLVYKRTREQHGSGGFSVHLQIRHGYFVCCCVFAVVRIYIVEISGTVHTVFQMQIQLVYYTVSRRTNVGCGNGIMRRDVTDVDILVFCQELSRRVISFYGDTRGIQYTICGIAYRNNYTQFSAETFLCIAFPGGSNDIRIFGGLFCSLLYCDFAFICLSARLCLDRGGPGFLAVTTPFLLTAATFFREEDQVTFFLLFFSFSVYFFPTFKVIFVLLSFGEVFAQTGMEPGIAKNTAPRMNRRNRHLFSPRPKRPTAVFVSCEKYAFILQQLLSDGCPYSSVVTAMQVLCLFLKPILNTCTDIYKT